MSNNEFMLYPIYIDATRTKNEGRKYSKIDAVESPKYSEIKEALQKLNYPYKSEEDKKHPAAQHMPGRFIIAKNNQNRKVIVLSILNILRELRFKKKEPNATKIPNTLKLVPKKKKKGKK